ncbi:potassium channel subfamily K member 17 [Xenopus laevis]|uniref:Potassium channel subfamily K member n=2 Tax=Xenopus laevis TaxID=8355 RepID=A0A974HIY5_XENLA|nr:potassium channel subfamily K member 17 [Xenopus laevis]OCT79548.1 hypothetical protein XELAEV_18026357mg [Xenopus laevis]
MPCCLRLNHCKVPVTLILLLIYICYLLVGAAIFWALESKAEEQQTLSFQQDKWDLLRNFTCMDNRTLELFITGVINAYKNGVIPQGNSSELNTWNYGGSFFFSVTVVTTIGYGNLSPTTVGGRAFCIFFALFGIPLNLILLNRIGHKMLSLVHRCGDIMGKKIRRQSLTKLMTSGFALLIGLLLFLLLPPVLFKEVEGWTYEEGLYYSFITLATIGFGDYVVGRNPDKQYPNWYRNLVAIWILFGLAWLALGINAGADALEKCKEKCPCSRKNKNQAAEEELMEPEGSLCAAKQDGDKESNRTGSLDQNKTDASELYKSDKLKYEHSQ